jgi:hypothetical protein
MLSTGLQRLQVDWPLLTYYQKFESIVALILTLIIGLIIVVALFRLTFAVVSGLLLGAFDPLDHEVFQTVFGEITTLLIALEFNHTLQYVVTRQQSIIQASVVLLIALLALARKFIILDLHTVTDGQLGPNTSNRALGLTHGIVVTLPDAASLSQYLEHPAHVPVAQALVADVAELRVMDLAV